MDDLDTKVLELLMNQGRLSWAELAGVVGLSPPAVADRVRRLEQRGVIKSYAALVNPDAVGCGLTAFVAVSLERPQYRAMFVERVKGLPEVQECHHTTGDHDYLLKVRCRDTRALEQLISSQLKELPGIVRTHTTVVLSTIKETVTVPLPLEETSAEDR